MSINLETFNRAAAGSRAAGGAKIECVAIRSLCGLQATFCNYGARLIELIAPDAKGNPGDVVLGYSDLNGYLKGQTEMGALVGRVANRIGKGRFTLDTNTYRLALNDGVNHLHGGLGGTMRRAFGVLKSGQSEVVFRLQLRDGEDGYPGNVNLVVVYAFLEGGRLRMSIRAETDRATPVNFCNHVYFNLADDDTILDHQLSINAKFYTPVDEHLIPTGEISSVRRTPFDFTKAVKIGERIEQHHEQLDYGRGYDHNFVLDKSNQRNFHGETLAAKVRAPSSGRTLEIWTTEPGVQFYSGNFLGQSLKPAGRRPLIRRSGFCLETQHFPDSINKSWFPNTILRPGELFSSSTTNIFGNARVSA
ncbi:MAG: galactose mutarotase [Deltaproteobacteria bacterium]|jgi:aldose 1-epimerase|nr:galactose mutarotase [Deltaproteobacteria bacterium]